MFEDWNDLEYDAFEKEDVKGARGFNFKINGNLIFAAIYEFLNKSETNVKISDTKF